MRFEVVLGLVASLFLTPAIAQDRPLPEELKALAVVCASSSTDLRVQGELEVGINKLFGKVLEGGGELDYTQAKNEFVTSFKDEGLRLEALRVANECLVSALEIAYNFKVNKNPAPGAVKLLVPDSLTIARPGEIFALLLQESIGLSDGTIFAIYGSRFGGATPLVRLSNSGRSKTEQLSMGESVRTADGSVCVVTYYAATEFSEGKYKYSFRYEC